MTGKSKHPSEKWLIEILTSSVFCGKLSFPGERSAFGRYIGLSKITIKCTGLKQLQNCDDFLFCLSCESCHHFCLVHSRETEVGFHQNPKWRQQWKRINNFLWSYLNILFWWEMADVAIDFNQLPEDIRLKLAELDLELSEGNWNLRYFWHFRVPVNEMSHSGSQGYLVVSADWLLWPPSYTWNMHSA